MSGRQRSRRGWLIAILFLCCTVAEAQTTIDNVGGTPDPVELYGKYEVTFSLGTVYGNPFDPDDADVRVRFDAPSGDVSTVIAFWTGDPFPTAATRDWKARFAPLESGTYTYTIIVDDALGHAEAGPFSFTTVPSTRKGFVGLDPYHRNTLRYSTGEPYHPFGHNLAWPDSFSTSDYQRWLSRFEENGLNWSRIWMNPYSGQGLEWSADDPTGRYYGIGRYSQPVSEYFDQILQLAEAHGVHFQMCIFSFNELTTGDFSNWDRNPYNAANGGPLTDPRDFFSNEFCRTQTKKLLRYVVARWGYSTSVMGWELFNEFNIITRTDFTTPGAWHSEMAAHIHSVDPFGHPVTTSLTNQLSGGLWSEGFWERPELDIIEEHRYSEDYPASQVRLADDGTLLGKPCLVGEVGRDPSGWVDTSGDAMRQMAWASALRLSGTMYWWWQPIDLVNSYPVYRSAVAFTDGEDWGARGLALADFATEGGPVGTQVYGIQSPYRAYAWIKVPDGGFASGLRVPGILLEPGEYDVEYWRTMGDGGILSSSRRSTSGNRLDLSVPNFTGDVAFKVLPITPEPTVTPLGTPATPTPVPTCDSGVLVSRGQPAFADSIFGAGFEPSKANDGVTDSEDSRWVSDGSSSHWWYVDLGREYVLDRVDVYGEESAGQGTVFNLSGYRIRASRTGAGGILNWDIVGEFDDPCGSPYPSYNPNSTEVAGAYRYVGLEITKNDGVCGPYARVLEVEVFACDIPPTPTPVPSGPSFVFY